MTKYFPGEGLWRGHVYSIDEDEDGEILYAVIYTDSDVEDMTESECMEAHTYYYHLESGKVSEWDVGDE